MNTEQTIRENMRRIRMGLGLKQTQLAQRMGVDRTVISKAENGGRKLSIEFLDEVANALKVPVNELFASFDKPVNEKSNKVSVEMEPSEYLEWTVSSICNDWLPKPESVSTPDIFIKLDSGVFKEKVQFYLECKAS